MANRWIVALVAGVMAATATWFHLGWLNQSGNFHEVVAGQVYRSAQPSPDDLGRYVAEYGIKSVINLRSSDMSKADRATERNAAARLGLTEIEYPMKANRELNNAQIAELVSILRDAPKPVLIHCKRGADRTGLASALYLQNIAGYDTESSERQLSIRYGHFGIPVLSAAYAMDQTYDAVEN